jgi:hypothetical protein
MLINGGTHLAHEEEEQKLSWQLPVSEGCSLPPANWSRDESKLCNKLFCSIWLRSCQRVSNTLKPLNKYVGELPTRGSDF